MILVNAIIGAVLLIAGLGAWTAIAVAIDRTNDQ